MALDTKAATRTAANVSTAPSRSRCLVVAPLSPAKHCRRERVLKLLQTGPRILTASRYNSRSELTRCR